MRLQTLAFIPIILLAATAVAHDCVHDGHFLHWDSGVDTPGEAHGIAIDGDYAYVADALHGLRYQGGWNVL